MNETAHILIIDDDKRLRKLLAQYLVRENFTVSEAMNAADAEDFLKLVQVDAMIMDVMMPHKNGDVFTQELRQKGNATPILMLTAKGDTDSRIIGLEAGADDYLAKPFEPKELLLRLNNLLKRQQTPAQNITFGPYTYQLKTKVLIKDGTPIALTGAEQSLLYIFLMHLNQEISREQLAAALNLDNTRSIDVQVTRLRKKLEPDESTSFIQTIRGKGYKLICT